MPLDTYLSDERQRDLDQIAGAENGCQPAEFARGRGVEPLDCRQDRSESTLRRRTLRSDWSGLLCDESL